MKGTLPGASMRSQERVTIHSTGLFRNGEETSYHIPSQVKFRIGLGSGVVTVHRSTFLQCVVLIAEALLSTRITLCLQPLWQLRIIASRNGREVVGMWTLSPNSNLRMDPHLKSVLLIHKCHIRLNQSSLRSLKSRKQGRGLPYLPKVAVAMAQVHVAVHQVHVQHQPPGSVLREKGTRVISAR
jgi:hypothetical protein